MVEGGNFEIVVNIDCEWMVDLGFIFNVVGVIMQNVFIGNIDFKFKDGEYDYDICVQFDVFDC